MQNKFPRSKSKIYSLIDILLKRITQGELKKGDDFPSINQASSKYNVSRDTVFKAYKELKRRGVIDSSPFKGYFVADDVQRVLLLLDDYSAFKQNLYYHFIDALNENYVVDMLFHQYNENLFNIIISESIGKYSTYVVMNPSNEQMADSLKRIPQHKLLLLDFGNFDKSDYSFICQDFNMSFYRCLNTAKEKILKYKKFILVFPEGILHPVSAIDSFRQFCIEAGVKFEIIRKSASLKNIEIDTLYLCILKEDMVRIIREADAKFYKLGKEVGLFAYNDDSILEVIKDGISSISVDFGLMGEKAAAFVNTKIPVQEYLETKVVFRGSV